jgi:precorrin-6B methylase 2
VSLVVDEHRQYLEDVPRLDAFAKALAALVRPGDVVLDLASGTGILGLLACQAGAARVYALEGDSIVELGRQIARANGLDDRIICIHEWSTRATLPEPVDLIVTDGAGRFGFEAGLIETLSDARRRFLKPGGRVIPSSLTLTIAPAETREIRDRVHFWAHPLRGLSFGPAHDIARSTGYPHHFGTDALLAEPSDLVTLDPSIDHAVLSGHGAFTIRRAATLDGIAGWFTAGLAPLVVLTNAPGAPGRINRRNVCFPLREPVPVGPGDTVDVTMHIRPATLLVRWRVDVRGADGRVRHSTLGSTFEGMLIAREDMARTRSAFQPMLTPAGVARRTVLELCDGMRPLSLIEDEVWSRHPHLFRTRDEAAMFVAEVVTRYAT